MSENIVGTQSDQKVAGHSPSQYVTGVVDRNAPDVVIVVLCGFSNSAQDLINKQITTDGYEIKLPRIHPILI